MKRKLIAAIIICLMMSLLIGTTAYAEEPVSTEISNEESYEEQVIDTALEETPDADEETVLEEDAGSPEEDPADTGDPVTADEDTTEMEKNVLPEEEIEEEQSEESVQPKAAEEITKDDEGTLTEQPAEEERAPAPAAEPIAEEPDKTVLPYVVTVSNGNRSVDLTGGTVNSISYILSELGYDVVSAEIEVDPESVDTEVISVDESEDGLALSDKGPFSKADRKLIVYINGEPVELTVVDPVEISGDKTAAEIETAFSNAADGNVKLIGNVNLIAESGGVLRDIVLNTGTHDLYLNGFTLNLAGKTVVINSAAILNIYGGANADSSGDGKIISEAKNTDVTALSIMGGALNVYSGDITASLNTSDLFQQAETNYVCGIDVLNHNTVGSTSKINIIGGSVTANASNSSIGTVERNIKAYGIRDSVASESVIRVTGGKVFAAAISNNENVITEAHDISSNSDVKIMGGTFNAQPENVSSGCKLQGAGPYSVESDTVVAVRIAADGTLTEHTTLSSAVSDSGTVVMLKNVQENITIESEKTIILDLNGLVLRGTGKGNVIYNKGNLTIRDSNAGGQKHCFTVDETGLWVLNETEGKESIRGGCITGGNDCEETGGIVNDKGTLTLTGGNVVGNKGNWCGGVHNDFGSTFIMTGGSIIGNQAVGCGGVYNYYNFIMTGGIITNNHGDIAGGVINAYYTILGGTARVIGNTATIIGNNFLTVIQCPICIGTGDRAPAAGMNIGITLAVDYESVTGQFTSNGTENDIKYFTCDNNAYMIVCKKGFLDNKYLVIAKREADSFFAGFSDVKTKSKPAEKDGDILVINKDISFSSLPSMEKASISKMLKQKGLTLVSTINTDEYIADMEVIGIQHIFEISSELFAGNKAEDLTVWFVNEDDTLVQVTFEIVNGNIVIKDGKPGVYLLTIKA